MNKVIYISIFPLVAQIEKFVYLQEVAAAGFDVRYSDLSGIYFKNLPFKNTISNEHVQKINSLDELQDLIKTYNLKETIFVVQVGFEWRVLSLYLMLTRYKCKTVYFSAAVQPGKRTIKKVIEKIKCGLFSDAFLRAFLNLLAKLIRKIKLVKRFDIVFAAGSLSGDAFSKHSKVVNINYVDCERYLLCKDNQDRLVSGDYCVFLDEGSVYNEDVKILNMDNLDPQSFFNSLNQFFDYVENKFEIKVVIAAHPGIKYAKGTFGERETYQGKTCELVKDCKFVISQSSFSVSFPVLYKKPIIFISTNDYKIKRKDNHRIIEFYANTLGLQIYNISSTEEYNNIQIPKVDSNRYDNYKYTYLTSKESEKKLSKDIVIETLRNSL